MILSKVWDPADELPTDVQEIVQQHWDGSQHWSRRWEYGMALEALKVWKDGKDYRFPRRIADVGGAGSPFRRMVDPNGLVDIIDPAETHTLEFFLTDLSARPILCDAVFCLSVIEHVEDLDQFLYHLSCLVAPGGLLFITTDYQPDDGPDNKHYHWMRKRIFGPVNRIDLSETLRGFQFDWLGEHKYDWHGPLETWGYAPASLALVKRR